MSDIRDQIFKSLREYHMSNMVFDDMPDAPFPLVDLCTPKGQSINKGEDELFLLADRIAADLPAADEIERLQKIIDHIKVEIPLLKSDNARVRENTIRVIEAIL